MGVHRSGLSPGKYKSPFCTSLVKSREGSTGGGTPATTVVTTTGHTVNDGEVYCSSTSGRAGPGAAAVAPGIRGDPAESSPKCISGAKDSGNTSLGYGGTSDCPDLLSTVTLVVATHSHIS